MENFFQHSKVTKVFMYIKLKLKDFLPLLMVLLMVTASFADDLDKKTRRPESGSNKL